MMKKIHVFIFYLLTLALNGAINKKRVDKRTSHLKRIIEELFDSIPEDSFTRNDLNITEIEQKMLGDSKRLKKRGKTTSRIIHPSDLIESKYLDKRMTEKLPALPRSMDSSFLLSILLVSETTECLYGHNKIRELYNTKKLQWDKDLEYESKYWALKLALRNDGAQHSSFQDSKGNKYGENLYWYSGSGQKNCHEAIYLWYQEYKDFDFLKPMFTYSAGHFIQMVWQPTYNVGVGIAFAHDQTWIVARYTPPEQTETGDIHDHVNPPGANPDIPAQSLIPPNNPKPFFETVSVTVKPSTEIDCVNNDENCEYWKSIGQCESNKGFMKSSCPKICNFCVVGTPINGGWTSWSKATTCSATCGKATHEQQRFCINPVPSNGGRQCVGDKRKLVNCNLKPCSSNPTCSDKSSDCKGYKDIGYCSNSLYKSWMDINCRQSCGTCCQNYHQDCEGYKDLNYCTDAEYGAFMKLQCPEACGFC